MVGGTPLKLRGVKPRPNCISICKQFAPLILRGARKPRVSGELLIQQFMYKPKDPKDNALHLLCLFLAEEMRMRSLSLGDAKEIARATLLHKNLIDNEEHMLRFMIELSKDYPQLKRFESKLAAYIERKSRSDAEKRVAQFVETIMETDQTLALTLLDDAINSDNSLEELSQKYPAFAEFLKNN
jgi:hypothetical protein